MVLDKYVLLIKGYINAVFMFFTFILMLSGCSPINEQMAEEKVIEFHDMYENKEYAKIYIQASDTLKNSGSESSFVSFLREAQNAI